MTFCIHRRRTIVKVSLDGVRVFRVWPCSAFASHGITYFCLSEALCLAPRLLFFLNLISRDWSDVTVVLVEVRWTSRRLHISSTAAIDYSYFPVGIARHCCSEEFSQSSKISVLCKSAIKSCDALLNLLIFCVCLKSWMNDYLCLWFSNLSINLLTLFSLIVFCGSTAERGSSYPVVHGVITDCPLTFQIPKMILRLGFVDLVDHVASSIWARLVALSELSAPSGGSFPEFSCIPLSQCKLLAVCWRERLHVTVTGKIASLSLERASNCTNILYIEGVSKFLLCRSPWFRQIAWSFSHAIYVFHRVHCSEEDRLSSSLEPCSSWNKSISFKEFNSFAFLLELLESTGTDWKKLDSRNIEILSSLLLLLPVPIFK